MFRSVQELPRLMHGKIVPIVCRQAKVPTVFPSTGRRSLRECRIGDLQNVREKIGVFRRSHKPECIQCCSSRTIHWCQRRWQGPRGIHHQQPTADEKPPPPFHWGKQVSHHFLKVMHKINFKWLFTLYCFSLLINFKLLCESFCNLHSLTYHN